jgi:organic radical activating enzyme
MTAKSTDFYCSQKFTWLSVDLEKRLTYSCCKAYPEKINLSWLKNNPGQIFNTELLKAERQSMLDNIPVESCRTACWIPESQGFTSRRLQLGQEKTHSDINAQPDTLNIILGSTCNLTCSYCCKQYSTSWLQDIKNNGEYLDSNRFKLLPIDHVLLKVSQKEHQNTDAFLMLLDEIKQFNNLKKVYISGGEPFLYNNLFTLLEKISPTAEIVLYTGLGVNHSRLINQIDKIKHMPNLKIIVSAENVDNFYEFNRHGNTYQNFESNLQLLIDSGFAVTFLSIISNLTVFGLKEFADKYQHVDINYDYCHDPDYLSVHVLDDVSKEKLTQSLESSNIAIKDELIQSLSIDCTQEQQKNCSIFVKEFASRRNLDLGIFPNSMLEWLNHVV